MCDLGGNELYARQLIRYNVVNNNLNTELLEKISTLKPLR